MNVIFYNVDLRCVKKPSALGAHAFRQECMTTMHRLEMPERTKLLKRFGSAYIRLNKVEADLLIRMVRLTQINLKRAGIAIFSTDYPR
jgi:hypothetical protein